MMRTSVALLGLCAFFSSFSASSLPPPARRSQPEEVLRKADHDALGKGIAKYFDAKQSNKKVYEALAELQEQVDKITKRLKDRDALSLVTDWTKAFYAARPGKRSAKPGAVSDASFESRFFVDAKGKPLAIQYAISCPAEYKPSEQLYPLLLLIPGIEDGKAESPKEHIIEYWKEQAILDSVIIAACPMPEDTELWDESGKEDAPGGVGLLLSILKEMLDNYAIDYDRIFLAGRGPGVAAALSIATRYPDRFAGVIGRAGDAGECVWENLRNLPTFFAGAGAAAGELDAKLREAGYTNCTLKPEAKEDEIWVWMQEHTRVAYPEHVTLLPGTPTPYKAYWIEVEPGEGTEGARIDAEVDRAANSIKLTSEGLPRATVYFNDTLLDLSKPVKVHCNGEEHEVEVPRRLSELVDLVFLGRCDPSRLFVNKMQFDLPEGTE